MAYMARKRETKGGKVCSFCLPRRVLIIGEKSKAKVTREGRMERSLRVKKLGFREPMLLPKKIIIIEIAQDLSLHRSGCTYPKRVDKRSAPYCRVCVCTSARLCRCLKHFANGKFC